MQFDHLGAMETHHSPFRRQQPSLLGRVLSENPSLVNIIAETADLLTFNRKQEDLWRVSPILLTRYNAR